MRVGLVAVKLAVLPYGLLLGERRPGIVILAYHRVGGGTDSEIDLPLAVFERQIAYVRDHYPVASMDALLTDTLAARAAAGPPAPDRVVVTFDDGVREIYTKVFPVLQRYQVPATVYLVTRHVEEQRPFGLRGYGGRTGGALPVTWTQVREMVESGLVTVGAHTHTHPDLTRLAPGEVADELDRSRALIEARVGVAPAHFAYPWGRVTPAVKRAVAQRFRTAVVGGAGKNVGPALDLLALWRQPVQQSDGFWLFRQKLKSYLDGEERIRRLCNLLRPHVDGGD